MAWDNHTPNNGDIFRVSAYVCWFCIKPTTHRKIVPSLVHTQTYTEQDVEKIIIPAILKKLHPLCCTTFFLATYLIASAKLWNLCVFVCVCVFVCTWRWGGRVAQMLPVADPNRLVWKLRGWNSWWEYGYCWVLFSVCCV